MLRIIGCIFEQHDLKLVALATLICVLACFTTTCLLRRGRGSETSLVWPVGAAIVFGAGVWSLHFVAMLAFMPGLEITYRLNTTIASALIATAGGLLGMLAWRNIRSRRVAVPTGAVCIGLAVAGMHYCGVEAMHVPGTFRFSADMVLASVIVAIVCSAIALFRLGGPDTVARGIEASCWLGLGIVGLHFTGMAALTLELGPASPVGGTIANTGPLAVAVASVSIMILALALAATLMDAHLSRRSVMELQRIRLLSDLSQEVVLIERHGLIVEINAAGGRLFGASIESLIGREFLSLVALEDRANMSHRLSRPQAGLKPEEIKVRGEKGLTIAVELASVEIDYDGRPMVAITLRDLSDRKRDEERIRHLAHHDVLTNLPNRFYLQERLTQTLALGNRIDGHVALFYVDLDRFKPVNDLLGHAAGDALLVEVGKRLNGIKRQSDVLARIGGDEFVIVAPVVLPAHAANMAERVLEELSRPFTLGNDQVEIGGSVGIALYPGDGRDLDSLMHAADTALYRAKNDGRGVYCFFEAEMDDALHRRRQFEQDLRSALAREEFVLYYQPLVGCADGEVAGFEALLRWRHPERGMVPPMEFIPLAEETGLIARIGQWVIETACAEAASWEDGRWVAVNISPVQFRNSDLPAITAAALARTGLPASRLEFEITENVLMENTERTLRTLRRLREIGVRVALDDFGTGYSSLSYLRSFAFDKLKIDRSFVQSLGRDEESVMIVRTIIALARNLGLSIAAEGVETEEQLALIRDHMCDEVQGYLLGRPAPLPATEAPRVAALAPVLDQASIAA